MHPGAPNGALKKKDNSTKVQRYLESHGWSLVERSPWRIKPNYFQDHNGRIFIQNVALQIQRGLDRSEAAQATSSCPSCEAGGELYRSEPGGLRSDRASYWHDGACTIECHLWRDHEIAYLNQQLATLHKWASLEATDELHESG